LELFITRINQTLRFYLDEFFDGQLTMELQTVRECKSGATKTEINLRIVYHSQEVALSHLSGGEYDRCSVAFLLSLNEICGSPFLILDESISSLDLNLSEKVLEVIKDRKIQGTIVLLVSHQANTGCFDHVLDMKQS
jgi:energy-coupling factor transporter ATP-binding protein EcfA2